MPNLMLVEAVNDALHVEMARDPNVMVIGEDVGRLGGVFRATARLQERFGADRCVDTPLAEAGILGTAVGLCMAGWRPVCEMQYDAFSYPSLDQLINHVGRYRWRTRGKMSFPLVVRMPYGGGVRAPELHDDSPETYYVHTPGVKVAIPSTPADAKGLLAAAIRDPDPVVVLEPKLVYRTARGDTSERVVDAYGLVLRGGRWYVVGHCHRSGEPRAGGSTPGGQPAHAGRTAILVDGGHNSEPEEHALRLRREVYDASVKRYIAVLAQILPDVPKDIISVRMAFLVGTYLFMLNDLGRIGDLTEGHLTSFTKDEMLDHLVRFLSAGLRAPV